MSQLIQFFSYEHLPAHLQTISKPICEFAKTLNKKSKSTWEWSNFIDEVDSLLPNNFEKTACLKKLNDAWNAKNQSEEQYRLLLESKDCAVRAFLLK